LGRREKKPSSTIRTKKEGIDLEGESQRTLNQLADALEQLFAKDAPVLMMMEMVWHFLKKKV
jgi:hypothetical protein